MSNSKNADATLVVHHVFNFCPMEIQLGTKDGGVHTIIPTAGDLRLKPEGLEPVGDLPIAEFLHFSPFDVPVMTAAEWRTLDPTCRGFKLYQDTLAMVAKSDPSIHLDVCHFIVSLPTAPVVVADLQRLGLDDKVFVYNPGMGPTQCVRNAVGQVSHVTALNLHNNREHFGWWRDASKYLNKPAEIL